MFPAVEWWVGGVGIRASGGHLPSCMLRICCPLEVSQCQCGWWSPSCGLFNIDILLLSALACPGATVLSAHSPPSSVSLAAFPAGILNVVSHLPTRAPFFLATSYGSHICRGSRGLFPACLWLQTAFSLANQSTSLTSSGFNHTFSNDVIKTQPWRETQHWKECPLPKLSFFG